jgi:hypothetical protein
MLVRTLLAGAVAVVAVTVTPARAQTTTGPNWNAALKRCYVSASPMETEPVQVNTSGWMAFAPIDVFVNDVAKTTAEADANGTLVGSTSAPYQATGQSMFTLRLTQHATQANPGVQPTLVATAKVTALEVSQSPAKSSTSQKVRFRGRGFTDLTQPIYAHYLLDGKSRATVLIGKPRFACGTFSARKRQFPMRKPHVGIWTIRFDQANAYSPQTSPFATLRVHVNRAAGR